jgi:hypothetical protein
LYVQYVARYQNIIVNLPPDVFSEGNKIASVEEDKKVWLTAYIDLCAEELFDHKRGAISKKTWQDWSGFIRDDFKRSLPLRERVVGMMTDYPELLAFLNEDEALRKELTAVRALRKL